MLFLLVKAHPVLAVIHKCFLRSSVAPTDSSEANKVKTSELTTSREECANEEFRMFTVAHVELAKPDAKLLSRESEFLAQLTVCQRTNQRVSDDAKLHKQIVEQPF